MPAGGVRPPLPLGRAMWLVVATSLVFMLGACGAQPATRSATGENAPGSTALSETLEDAPERRVGAADRSAAAAPEPTAVAVSAPSPTAVPTPVPTPTPLPTVTPQAVSPPAYAPGAAQVVLTDGPLAGLTIGLIANPASVIDGVATIDMLVANPQVEVAALFAPEHGPRGTLGAGELVDGGIDPATGIVVHSLYGDTRKPTPDMLVGLDAIVYDLQGAGVRFYTYVSTMGLAMQAAADADIAFVVLDRPNPLGGRVDGHVLEPGFDSFIGQYPIPAQHGLTAGELAQAIMGEGWLPGLADLDLRVVPMSVWSRSMTWTELGVEWVPPSPGLATVDAALAYPGTVLFEATSLSYGRGTDQAFEQVGAPWLDVDAVLSALAPYQLPGVTFEAVSFEPQAGSGATVAHAGVVLPGIRWRVTDPATFEPVRTGVAVLHAVVEQGRARNITVIDRPEFLDLLAGTDRLRLALARPDGSLQSIVDGWRDEADAFNEAMQRYRLYAE